MLNEVLKLGRVWLVQVEFRVILAETVLKERSDPKDLDYTLRPDGVSPEYPIRLRARAAT